ncbi:ABC-2 type transport system permease protein [Humibacillus xanthopallidus]|uniref:ABC-2 type transport system permease protein n=1 Tax=Humibacillus xanthopallidus TaxID=412689 RepID=A0A543PXG9_9MICO|nr:polyketide antibiotic transporter [Humibacillus xanthopallidus]TQN48740.1 ABC-2 type transport system permease protein [Humibacillus xanthopallidus]
MTATSAPTAPSSRPGRAGPPRSSGLTGTTRLLRLAARRDRVLIPASALTLMAVVAGSAKATFDLYPDPSLASPALRETLDNPALVAIYGPVASMSIDALATFKTVLLGGVFLCLLAYVVVRRHTRTEEEEGRLELLGSGVVGRRAPLAAAVLLATAAVLGTSVLTVVGAVAVGLGTSGSIALGVSWAVMGLTWVGVTAVAAQLTETARGTAGFALGALAAAYLLRALGDASGSDSPGRVLTWLSPLGWAEKVEPYGANRVWVLVVGVIAYAVLVLVAFALLERRDLGAGVLPSRPGPDRGSLRTVGGLTRRLARGTLIGWTIGYVVLGAVVGSLGGSVQSFVDSPEIADMLRKLGGGAGTIIDTFFATELRFAAIGAAALGIALTTRMRTEETSGRVEAVLATSATRLRWAAAHIVVALAATALVLAVVGTVAGLVDGGRTGDVGGSVGRLVGASLAALPAVWVCIAVAVLLVGLVPRLTGLVWAVLIGFLVLGEFGPIMNLPSWVTAVSPFDHLSHLPGGSLDTADLLGLVVVAAALTAAGLAGLRRRDIA